MKKIDPVVRIGKTLRALRVMKGLTQKEIAPKLGISQNHLSNIEKGAREPGIVFLTKFARFFSIPIDLFFLLALEPGRLKEAKLGIMSDLQNLLFAIIDND